MNMNKMITILMIKQFDKIYYRLLYFFDYYNQRNTKKAKIKSFLLSTNAH